MSNEEEDTCFPHIPKKESAEGAGNAFWSMSASMNPATIYLFILQVIWRGLLSVGSLEQVQVLPCL